MLPQHSSYTVGKADDTYSRQLKITNYNEEADTLSTQKCQYANAALVLRRIATNLEGVDP